MTTLSRQRAGAVIGSLAAITLLAAGCGATAGDAPEETATDDQVTQEAETGTDAADAIDPADVAAGDRLAVSIEGAVLVLDSATLEVLGQFETEEFTRLNASGDGRNVFVTTEPGFQVLDTATPELTDTVFAAEAAAHVVRHAGKTVLYADGTGETTILDTDAILASDGGLPEVETYQAEHAHHGVSIVLEDGTLLTTVGDDTGRTGALALEPHGDHYDTIAEATNCPGIHGEGTAQNEAVVFGCEDGALLYSDGEFTKFDAGVEYGRMGNAFVSETSPIVVGDYKDDQDAEGYFLNNLVVLDTEAGEYETLNIGDIEYTWRGITRGPQDLAYVLSSDGSIHVFDPEAKEFTDEFPVIDAWESPVNWQDPHPALTSDGVVAYVADVANERVIAVDLATGEIIAESDALPAAPNEMALNL
ncbi:zinc metallochaperone AztD [Microbacterium amylolyticum]|uniref:Secreted protein n=1 Tax=Microbacterium amylolyticum TaxID=936337 RepID=A0ABS4ZI69_9MICO|nr:zinc metallochaperone AztD [Microbacterium amylolyticum]MBP2436970.1 hypothetical protein [Microbacterium amylolyticum]